jgi:4'-phosphopantetheinyl transferase
MFSHDDRLGPVRYAWRPHRHGTPAESVARPWLAQALEIDADALPLRRDAHGRPRLAAPVSGFDANWSHSGEGLLIALGERVQVGADLELLRPRPHALALAGRYFAASEAAALRALPAAEQERAFVRLWCAKEAVLKAHGRGLAFGLHRLEFALRDGDWALVACDPALGTATEWTLSSFAPQPGYVAALAWRPLQESQVA